MPQLKINMTVEGSPEQVFRVFSDFEHAAEAVTGITKIELLTDGPVDVGTRFRESRVMFKKEATEEMHVTVFDPNKSYTITCDSCGCIYTSTFQFSPAGTATDVEVLIEGKAISLFAKIMSPLTSLMFGPMMRKCVVKDMEDLKGLIEGRNEGAPPLAV